MNSIFKSTFCRNFCLHRQSREISYLFSLIYPLGPLLISLICVRIWVRIRKYVSTRRCAEAQSGLRAVPHCAESKLEHLNNSTLCGKARSCDYALCRIAQSFYSTLWYLTRESGDPGVLFAEKRWRGLKIS
jgi:hypothetical protein